GAVVARDGLADRARHLRSCRADQERESRSLVVVTAGEGRKVCAAAPRATLSEHFRSAPQGAEVGADAAGVLADVALADAAEGTDVDAAARTLRLDANHDVVLEAEEARGVGGLDASVCGRGGDDLPALGPRRRQGALEGAR